MPTETPTYEIEIPASELLEAEQFEAARREAYGQQDMDARSEQLSRLVAAAKITGDIALEDVVLEKITHPEDDADRQVDEATKRFEEISDKIATAKTRRAHTETTYRIAVDNNGGIQGVSKIEPVAEDEEATKRNQRAAARIGYGPKSNDSSFRTSNVARGQVKL